MVFLVQHIKLHFPQELILGPINEKYIFLFVILFHYIFYTKFKYQLLSYF